MTREVGNEAKKPLDLSARKKNMAVLFLGPKM